MHPKVFRNAACLSLLVALLALAGPTCAAATKLYLTADAGLTPEAPMGEGFSEPVRTWLGPVSSNPGGIGFWSFDMPSRGSIVPVEARLWVKVDQPFVPPVGTTNGVVACPLYLEQGIVDGDWYYYCNAGAFGDTGIVIPGVYEVVFTWAQDLPRAPVTGADQLYAFLATDSSLAAAPTITLLGGSPDHPSHVSFDGLVLPTPAPAAPGPPDPAPSSSAAPNATPPATTTPAAPTPSTPTSPTPAPAGSGAQAASANPATATPTLPAPSSKAPKQAAGISAAILAAGLAVALRRRLA